MLILIINRGRVKAQDQQVFFNGANDPEGRAVKDIEKFRKGYPSYGTETFTMNAINKGFELLGSIGKPVVITEFNGPSRNNTHSPENRDKIWTLSDEENSAWQINFYKFMLSKPHIIELIRWYTVDDLGGRRMDAGILFKDGRKYQIYYDLKN